MFPFIHLGSFTLPTFGLLLWLAAVAAGVVLHRSFVRDGVDADALNVVTLVVLGGILGAKTWHELQNPAELTAALRHIAEPGASHLGTVLLRFGEWMRSGIAWYGGLVAGVAMLMWQGIKAKPNGLLGLRAGVRMLDFSAAAAAVGYGVGRIGCLTSGDGDYGRNTTSAFWGVHLKPDALVPARPLDALVLPTPLWEFGIALLLAWILWRLGARARPLGWMTGCYLVLSGVARFVVEFWRINEKLYLGKHLSNAQMAALGTILVGTAIVVAVRGRVPVGGAVSLPEETAPVAA